MTQRIGLQGVPQNSPLGLEVAQLESQSTGQTPGWGPTDPAWGPPTPGVSATITVARSKLKVAPEGMVFKVANLVGFDTAAPVDPDAYDPQFHGLYYFWNYGDPGSTFTKTLNVLAQHKNANLGYGPIGAHTYAAPGDYTVSVLIIEPISGKWTIAHLRLDGADAVGDPDALFVEQWQNVYVDPDGDYSWVPPGHTINYTTLALAYNYLRTRLLTIPYRIILRDGKVHEAGGTSIRQTPGSDRGYPNIYIVGQGVGTKPVVNHSGAGGALFGMYNYDPDGIGKDFVIHGVNFTGPYQASVELETNRSLILHTTDSGNYLLVNDVELDGLASAYASTSGLGLCSSIFSNVEVRNWRGYAFFQSSFLPSAFLGVKVTRELDARSGGPQGGKHNDSGGWRINGASYLVVDGCEGFSRCGWTFARPGFPTAQPAFRWNWNGIRGARLNMQRSSFEGGGSTISMTAAGRANVQNALIERCVIIGASVARYFCKAVYGGLTLRNNLLTFMDTAERFSGDWQPYYGLRLESIVPTISPSDLAESQAGPIIVVNNTFISEWSNSNRDLSLISNHGGYSNITEANNIFHDPYATTPAVADAPFTYIDLYPPRDTAGLIVPYERVFVTLASDVTNGGSITVPYAAGRSAGDYALGSYVSEPQEMYLNDNLGDDHIADVVFGGSDMTVTNNSGTTWPVGTHTLVLFCPTSPVTLPEYGVTTPQVRLPIPATGSAALGAADETVCPIGDFFGNLRPIYPSLGACEALSS